MTLNQTIKVVSQSNSLGHSNHANPWELVTTGGCVCVVHLDRSKVGFTSPLQ